MTLDRLIYRNSTHLYLFLLPLYYKAHFLYLYLLEIKKQKSARGLGFGLFITWHVIRLHGMRLEYKREGEMNHFIIYI